MNCQCCCISSACSKTIILFESDINQKSGSSRCINMESGQKPTFECLMVLTYFLGWGARGSIAALRDRLKTAISLETCSNISFLKYMIWLSIMSLENTFLNLKVKVVIYKRSFKRISTKRCKAYKLNLMD
ncbi:hypothetical protein ACKWTF_013818 [Chironomus riparius]